MIKCTGRYRALRCLQLYEDAQRNAKLNVADWGCRRIGTVPPIYQPFFLFTPRQQHICTSKRLNVQVSYPG